MVEKDTPFQRQKKDRDAKLVARYRELMAQGYMKMQVYEQLREEFGFYSVQGVSVIIRRAEGIEKKERKIEPKRIQR